MRKYYFYKDSESLGPFSTEELKTKDITKDTLVWCEGMETWQKASDLSELKTIFDTVLPQDSSEYRRHERYSDDYVPQIRPWVRYWARLIDSFLFGFILATLFGGPSSDKELIYNIFVGTIWVGIEPIFLSIFGTTFGKWLLGIKLIKDDMSEITYLNALKRSFTVWWKGTVFGIPLLNLIGYAFGRNSLVNTGKTTWDRDGGFTIVHNKIHPLKIITIVLMFSGYIYLRVLSNYN